MHPEATSADTVVELAERIARVDRLEAEVAALGSALTAANEALERRQKDDRRLRMLAARETTEARAAGVRENARLRVEFQQQLAAAASALEAQRALTAAVMFERDQVLTSAAWRATWPLRKVADLVPARVRHGLRACLKAGWWTVTGQLAERLRRRRAHFEALRASPSDPAASDRGEDEQLSSGETTAQCVTDSAALALTAGETDAQEPTATPVEALLEKRFDTLRPLPIFPTPATGRRLTVVLDGLGADGAGAEISTALVLGALLAQRSGADLRLATRMEPAIGLSLAGEVLAMNGIDWAGDVECIYAPGGLGSAEAAGGSADRFLAASWQSAWAVSRSAPPESVALIVHQDERELLAAGDDRLRCHETLTLPGLRLIVPHGALIGRFQREGFALEAAPFDLAFPRFDQALEAKPQKTKQDIVLFGGPDQPGGLYWRSLEALALAMRTGVIDPQMWNFTFVGSGCQDLTLPFGVRPRIEQVLRPPAYCALVSKADIGLCLNGAGYPALAVAANGGVGITGPWASHPPASSDNVLAVEPDIASVERALRRAVVLAGDIAARQLNYEQSRFLRDWRPALAPALEQLGRWFDS